MNTLTDQRRQDDRAQWWNIHDKETYTCPDCGRQREDIRRWEVHHINGTPGKIVGLCQTCHKVRHGAERWRIDLETWKDEFVKIGT